MPQEAPEAPSAAMGPWTLVRTARRAQRMLPALLGSCVTLGPVLILRGIAQRI